jgi:deoxyribodipyrimidine photo-lyase
MRRALRVEDNHALEWAMNHADEVVPVLCLSTDARYMRDTPRRRYVNGCMIALDNELRKRGSRLFVIVGKPEQELPACAARIGATLVTAVRLYDPTAAERDVRVQRALQSCGVSFELVNDRVLLEANEVLTQAGTPFRVFTPYRHAWSLRSAQIEPVLPRVRRIPSPVEAEGSLTLEKVPHVLHCSDDCAGERAAHERMRAFFRHSARRYHHQRDFPARDGTSRLSAALSVGAISIRRVFHTAREVRNSCRPDERSGLDVFIQELIWREFYYSILCHFPRVVHEPFREEYAKIRWSANERHFAAWREGRTGFPIVDAGMRQLQQEGWMHNRVRMIVASFLVKDLRINWQWGERFFLEHLIDADIANNNGGWQWTAGTGTDAAPWFRIFNPALQGKRFDPEGAYVKRYVPELSRVPVRFLHTPERMPAALQRDLGCTIGKDYPLPIVHHAEASRAVKQWFAGASSRNVK